MLLICKYSISKRCRPKRDVTNAASHQSPFRLLTLAERFSETQILTDHFNTHKVIMMKIYRLDFKVSKGAKIRNRYHQVPHMTQDTNGKVTISQFDTPYESQEVSPFPQAQINRRAQRNNKHKTEKT